MWKMGDFELRSAFSCMEIEACVCAEIVFDLISLRKNVALNDLAV